MDDEYGYVDPYDFGGIPDTGGSVYSDDAGTYYGSGPSMDTGSYYYPSDMSMVAGRSSGYIDPSAALLDAWNADPSIGLPPSGGNFGGGGGVGGGPRGVAAMQPQLMTLGSPERTLYDRYAGLLKDPASFASDPGYQFLFGQGMNALNRTAAASGKTFAGQTMTDATKFGEDFGMSYLSKMLPLYQSGAQEELRRFMGPAGLLPSYVNSNNNAIQQAGASQAAQDMAPMLSQAYMNMLNGGGGSIGGSAGSKIGFGGMNSDYSGDYPPRLAQAYSQPQPQPQSNLPNNYYDDFAPGNLDTYYGP